ARVVRAFAGSARASRRSIAWRSRPHTREDDRDLAAPGLRPGGFQHVLHGGYEARAGVGRDHPLPIAVRFERVFFRVRPIVLSLAFSTMLNSTTFSSSRRRLQRANPPGAGNKARVISFASAAPS